jgi:hypothetical protein
MTMPAANSGAGPWLCPETAVHRTIRPSPFRPATFAAVTTGSPQRRPGLVTDGAAGLAPVPERTATADTRAAGLVTCGSALASPVPVPWPWPAARLVPMTTDAPLTTLVTTVCVALCVTVMTGLHRSTLVLRRPAGFAGHFGRVLHEIAMQIAPHLHGTGVVILQFPLSLLGHGWKEPIMGTKATECFGTSRFRCGLGHGIPGAWTD